jgi:NitT/TauT family transport system substrate-binding protein
MKENRADNRIRRKVVINHLRRQVLWVLILAVLLMPFCISCGEKHGSSESVTLRVVITPFLAHAPLFVAQEEGYFTEQGLEVEFVKMISSGQAVPALIEGEVDVISGALRINLLNAMVRDAEIRFVADLGHVSSGGCIAQALMARPALAAAGKLDSPAQLRNRRIATNPSVYAGYFLEKLLNPAGMTLEDVQIVNIPSPARPEALQKGAVDLVTSSEPWVTRMLQAEQAVVWMPYRQVIPDFQTSIIVYGPTLLTENVDAGKRFMVAYLKAVQQYNQGKTARNIEILAEHIGLDEGLLKNCCWPSVHSDGRINCESVSDFQQWAVKKGLLDSLIPKEQFWDPSFVEHACQALNISTR